MTSTVATSPRAGRCASHAWSTRLGATRVTGSARSPTDHGEISDERAQIALQHLALLDLNRYAHSDFLTRIWALKDNVSAYDGAYVSLAEALGATLVTGDRRLTKASGTRAVIELLG